MKRRADGGTSSCIQTCACLLETGPIKFTWLPFRGHDELTGLMELTLGRCSQLAARQLDAGQVARERRGIRMWDYYQNCTMGGNPFTHLLIPKPHTLPVHELGALGLGLGALHCQLPPNVFQLPIRKSQHTLTQALGVGVGVFNFCLTLSRC